MVWELRAVSHNPDFEFGLRGAPGAVPQGSEASARLRLIWSDHGRRETPATGKPIGAWSAAIDPSMLEDVL